MKTMNKQANIRNQSINSKLGKIAVKFKITLIDMINNNQHFD